jgi:hypothetical protein
MWRRNDTSILVKDKNLLDPSIVGEWMECISKFKGEEFELVEESLECYDNQYTRKE